MVWRSLRPIDTDSSRDAPLRALLVGIWAAGITGLAAVTAAGAEIWRYSLMLRGRTEVLPGTTVSASDHLVTVAAAVVLVAALVTAIVIAGAFVRLHAGAARRNGLEPSRPAASVLARLVVPGWNVWGLGVVAGEIDGLLSAGPDRPVARPRLSRLVLAFWVAWIVDIALVLITLVRAFATSDQAVADTVELHIFVDLAGAVVAVLAAFVCRRFRQSLRGASGGRGRWVVAAPAPTRTAQPDLQPAMLNTAPGSPEAGPDASHATVSASTSGDQPVDEAAEEPTTVTPTP